MQTPRNTLIEDMPSDTLVQTCQALGSLIDHLSKRADLEHETGVAATAEVFDGMFRNAVLIKEAIEYEAARLNEVGEELDFDAWIRGFPTQFPKTFDDQNPYRNPFIRQVQRETYDAVQSGIEFLQEVISPNSPTPMGNQGHYWMLQCLSSAMAFEAKYRGQGGFDVTSQPS